MNNVKIDKDAWVENSILKGNIEVGPGVLIQDSFIIGDFKITRNESSSYFINSGIVGEGELINCKVYSSKINLVGVNNNILIEHFFDTEEKTLENINLFQDKIYGDYNEHDED